MPFPLKLFLFVLSRLVRLAVFVILTFALFVGVAAYRQEQHQPAKGNTLTRTHANTDRVLRRPSSANAAIATMFGYTGRSTDPLTKLQDNRARAYDPTLGRFISQDPIGFDAGDANLYRMVGNHPSYATDPSGLIDDEADRGKLILDIRDPVRTVRSIEGLVTRIFTRTHDNRPVYEPPIIGVVPQPKQERWSELASGIVLVPLANELDRLQDDHNVVHSNLVGVQAWDPDLQAAYFTVSNAFVARFLSDSLSNHDAVDGHFQSTQERMSDGFQAAIQFGGAVVECSSLLRPVGMLSRGNRVFSTAADAPIATAKARNRLDVISIDVTTSNQLMSQFDVIANPVGRTGHASPGQAAYCALQECNMLSIVDNTEYGGLIFRQNDGTYGYTLAQRGTPTGFDPSSVRVPRNTTVVGDYHTHGDYSLADSLGRPVRTSNPLQDAFNSDNFSVQDIIGISADGLGTPGYTGYLGTPSGRYLQYRPRP